METVGARAGFLLARKRAAQAAKRPATRIRADAIRWTIAKFAQFHG